ncbi:hypothetical protein [Aeromonas hydrophila]|uniref:Uncharacterized protein n=1 Tax=Aeromonas hydrophila TaxID=644 RepID=A0AAX3P068_AERHY|nr:hypothetical protein [Aeromonas hydrophila]WEE24774.1 hypothetical protein PY771_13915 [Aeromonas hydrophila]HDT5891972.1 hypothetical protein [Aeromonas hydrophila subsp. hydrophila]
MWPYRKVVTQSLKTPLVIARVLVYIALLLLLPLPLIIFSGSLVGGAQEPLIASTGAESDSPNRVNGKQKSPERGGFLLLR